MGWQQVVNALLYVVGSAVFIPASILFHPTFSSDSTLYLFAVSAFISGSGLFVLAALHSLLLFFLHACCSEPQEDAEHVGSAPSAHEDEAQSLLQPATPEIDEKLEDLHIPSSCAHQLLQLMQRRWGIPLLTTWLPVQGGLLFLAGSVAFLPQYGSDGATIGNGLFRAGSCSYILGTWPS